MEILPQYEQVARWIPPPIGSAFPKRCSPLRQARWCTRKSESKNVRDRCRPTGVRRGLLVGVWSVFVMVFLLLRVVASTSIRRDLTVEVTNRLFDRFDTRDESTIGGDPAGEEWNEF